MADYTNLESFSNLKNGDTITYTEETKIDFRGSTVNIAIYGNPGQAEGGITSFTFDSSKDGNGGKSYYFSTNGGVSLCYGSSYDKYYRIACAGDGGIQGSITYDRTGVSSAYKVYTYSSYTPGNGGGSSGGNAPYVNPPQYTSAGTIDSEIGTFEQGGTKSSTISYTDRYHQYITWYFAHGQGGNGWYGGNSGKAGYGGSLASNMSAYVTPGNGGSGHVIISNDTSISSYMGGDSSLISKLASACTNISLQTGGSSEPKMVITIVSINAPSSSVIKYNTPNGFIDTEVYYYTEESNFVKCVSYYYNGTEWIETGGS